MSWMKGRRARLGSLLGRGRAETRMDEEFAFHIEQATEENVRAGMDPVEARRRALIAFGGVERHRESMRDTWRFIWLEDLAADVRFALRWLARSPGFALVAVLTIGLGVGATTALFSVTNALLLRPLPVAEPEGLFSIQEERTGYVMDGMEGMQVPQARYEAYVEAAQPLVAGLAGHSSDQFSLRADGPAQPASGVLVSGNYFQVLGVRPALGRLFSASDAPEVVLSYALWQRLFGGEPDVVGRLVHVDGRPLTVVGVAERGFTGTNVGLLAELWVPYRAATVEGESVWAGKWLVPVGRLREDVDPRQAAAMLPAIATRIDVDAEGAEVSGARLEPITGLPRSARPAVAGFLGLLVGMAVLVLCIAAANIGGMQLARAVRRRSEMGIRLAVGAGRGRLIRQLLTESLVLSLIGGAVGLLIAWGATVLVGRVSFPFDQAILLDVRPQPRVLVFGIALAAAAGIGFGLLPALRASRVDVGSMLKGGGGRGATRAGRGRGAFLTAQIALAVVLLSVAGLFARTLQSALGADPGFEPGGVVIASFNLSAHGYDEPRGRTFQDQLVERVRAMPGVEAVALARVPLLTGSNLSYTASPAEDLERKEGVGVNFVDPGYFRLMGIELLAGRGFPEHAAAAGAGVTVVNETLARRFWPGEPPIGKMLRRGGTELEVVGVARDGLYQAYTEQPRPFAFFPRQESYSPQGTLHVRTGTPAAEMVERIRQEVMSLDPDVSITGAGPLRSMMGMELLPQRIGAYLVGVFGLLGLVLAGVGVYGVLSYTVAERTRELGIRMALGASAPAVRRLVMRGVMLVALIGVSIGIGLSAMLGPLMKGLLFGISAHDPVTFLGVPLLLALVAVLASYFPVRRAVRADPVAALRQE